MFWELLVLAVLILINGFFAMAELAIVSSRRVRLQEAAKAGKRGAAAALSLIDDPVGFLSTVQVGITLVGIVAGAYSAATFAGPFGEILKNIPAIAVYAEEIAFAVVVVAVTYFSLVIGELVPKRIALNHAETIAAAVAPLMRLLAKVGAPFVWFLRFSTHAVMALLRLKPAPESAVTEEEVKALIAEGASSGVFQPAERELIEGVLRMGDRAVRSIMVPRTAVVWLDVEDTQEEIYAAIAESGHSRYPVARGDIEDVIGVAHTKDLLEQQRKTGTIDLIAAAREAPYVVDRMPVLRLLERFKSSSVHMAFVVDEHGSFEGIVTPTDILTTIAGDLPQSEEEAEPEAVQREDGSWLIDGLMAVDAAERTLGIEGMAEEGDFNTVAGFVLHELGHLPVAGENFEWHGWRFEVVDLDGRRIDKILASGPKPETEIAS
ncbi:MAG: hemolysin family protein [Methyloceanibacter sp.]|uniref:hemolysin family protein n=1 Tax=Methyloceanibacter sp. TaxID=1965321 RepID=UPI003D9AF43B